MSEALTGTTETGTSALHILRAGLCSAGWLMGTKQTGRQCSWRCEGRHHGEVLILLARQVETITASPKPNRADRRRQRKGRRG